MTEKTGNLSHDEAIKVICDCAATVTVLSYQEAIEGYLDLRGISPEACNSHDALISENKRMREALGPFVDLRYQSGAFGVISKKLDDMQPLTVTVTKAQFRAACEAAMLQHVLDEGG